MVGVTHGRRCCVVTLVRSEWRSGARAPESLQIVCDSPGDKQVGDRRLSARVSVMLLMFLFAGIVSDAQARMVDAPRVQVLTVERKPFAMQNDGRAEGFSVQLWRALSERLDWQSEIGFADSFSDMLEQVKKGEVDLAIGNISITAGRESSGMRSSGSWCIGDGTTSSSTCQVKV